jgi:hypothetical protein
MRSNTCPKCAGSMTQGFVLDHNPQSSRRSVSSWIEGAPIKSIWTGLKIDSTKKRDIETLRCSKCGFLESYAR